MTPVRIGPTPHLQRTLSFNERHVPDSYAGDIGDGVERAGAAFKWDTNISRARLGLPLYGHRAQEREMNTENCKYGNASSHV